MDMLAWYGAESDSEDNNATSPTASPRLPAAYPAPAVQSSTAASQPGGLFAKLPGPNSAAEPSVGLTGRIPVASSLPASGPDSSAAFAQADNLETPAGLPAGFFDSSTASAAAPSAPDVSDIALSGPVRPAAAPAPDFLQPNDPELWKQLPAPGTAAAKRKVLFRPQINLELLAGSDSDAEDDGPAVKKPKPATGTGKPNILSFLPAPKNQPQAPKGLGGGTRLQASATNSTAAGPAPSAAEDVTAVAGPVMSNESYRVAQPAAAEADDYGQSQQYGQQQYEQYQQQYGAADQTAAYSYEGYDYSSGSHNSSTAAAAGLGAAATTATLPPEAFLQEALQTEASKAARRTAGAGSAPLMMPDIQFKEIKADKIKYVDPAQREAAQGMRAALGSDYAAKLRAQAAPHGGSKLARSKHQIGTLFANAKLRELEVLENRATGMKSKAETAGKYGWR